jgi:hypothetical protein
MGGAPLLAAPPSLTVNAIGIGRIRLPHVACYRGGTQPDPHFPNPIVAAPRPSSSLRSPASSANLACPVSLDRCPPSPASC